MRKVITYDEIIQQITEAYECLDGDELAEVYNNLFPGQPITYEGDSIFARYMDGVSS